MISNLRLSLDRTLSDESILRLRLDIRDFDFGQCLDHIMGKTDLLAVPMRLPRLLQFLKMYGAYPFPQRQSTVLGNGNEMTKNEKRREPDCRKVQSDGKNGQENSDSDARQQLLCLSKGGGVPIDRVVQQVNSNFNFSWVGRQSNKRMTILSMAKHLCGGATDAALRYTPGVSLRY